MRKALLILAALICVFNFSGCSQNLGQKPDASITVSAAASLKEAMEEIKTKVKEEKGIELTLILSSSGTLQKQIEEGAPTDIFISAGQKQMNTLESERLIDKDSRKDLLTNKLALVVSNDYKEKINTVEDLANNDIKISIGDVNTVPAGQYAKESLISLNIWDKINNTIVYGKDVKQVLTYVENGDVAAGIVYRSDAITLKNSFILSTFDEKSHSPIVYPAAIVSASKDKASAKIFMDYLNANEAKLIFEKYGFEVK